MRRNRWWAGLETRKHESEDQSGDPDAEPPKPKVAEKVPAKYNSATELKETVKAGANTFDFELQSGGKIVEPTPEKSTAGPGRPR